MVGKNIAGKTCRAAGLMLLTGCIGSSANAEISSYDKFRLWNECSGVDLLIEHLSEDELSIGLSEESIESTIRSRLRSARIFNEDHYDYIYVQIGVLDSAWTVNMELRKIVRDMSSEEMNSAQTWSNGRIGTHANDHQYILGSLATMTDQFVDEYFRVNDSACG